MTHPRLLLAMALLAVTMSCSGPASPKAGRTPAAPGSPASPTPVAQALVPDWPTQVRPLGTSPGTATPYAVTQDAVFGLWEATTATATPFAQPAGPTDGGPPTLGQPIVGASGLAYGGGWVWVVTNPGASANAELFQLNRTSLTVASQRSLPIPISVLPNSGGQHGQQEAELASAGPWLWVAAGPDLFKVDAATGNWTPPLPEGEELSSISADPAGRLLYTGGETAAGVATVREYSASSGDLLRQITIPGAIVAPEVAATEGGVWVGYTTGLRGGAELLSSQTLTRIEPLAAPGETAGAFDRIGGVAVSVSDGALWLSGQSSLSCVDPRTAAVGASETVTSPPTVIADSGVLYASDAGAIDVVSPPAACFR